MCYEDVSYMFRLCYSDESADIFLIFVQNQKEEEMPMKDFAAIDFETANGERSSVCSVGIVIVRDGVVREKIYRLIRPFPNYYSYWNTQVHGLTRQDTDRAPELPRLAPASLWPFCRRGVRKNGQKTVPLSFHNRTNNL